MIKSKAMHLTSERFYRTLDREIHLYSKAELRDILVKK